MVSNTENSHYCEQFIVGRQLSVSFISPCFIVDKLISLCSRFFSRTITKQAALENNVSNAVGSYTHCLLSKKWDSQLCSSFPKHNSLHVQGPIALLVLSSVNWSRGTNVQILILRIFVHKLAYSFLLPYGPCGWNLVHQPWLLPLTH